MKHIDNVILGVACLTQKVFFFPSWVLLLVIINLWYFFTQLIGAVTGQARDFESGDVWLTVILLLILHRFAYQPLTMFNLIYPYFKISLMVFSS